MNDCPPRTADDRIWLQRARALLDAGLEIEARAALDRAEPEPSPDAALERAQLERRAQRFDVAQRMFARAGDRVARDPHALLAFAQVKAQLARRMPSRDQFQDRERLNRESVDLLVQALQLPCEVACQAWCWFELARLFKFLGEPVERVIAALEKASALAPAEGRFRRELDRRRMRVVVR